MDLIALPIGTVIVMCCLTEPLPAGWTDITGSFQCMDGIKSFQDKFPHAGEFVARDPLFCIKKVAEEGTS
jgi:hypothetical protein